jgi:hypothetical protein
MSATAAVTEVIILFAGLTVWSDQIPTDYGVKAILPRVVHDASTDAVHNGVEEHTAAIVFRRADLENPEEWAADLETLESGTGASTADSVFQYVRLDGESVRFGTNGATNTAPVLGGVMLPRLQRDLCPAAQRLTADYQHPYEGAAAVVALPQGRLQACLSLPADSDGRLDTRLDLKTAGTLVISIGPTRKLRLKPPPQGRPIVVMIANMPTPFFTGSVPTRDPRGVSNLISHEAAYHAMTVRSAGCALSLWAWWNQLSNPDPIGLCEADMAFEPDGPITSTSLSTSGANFACSNTNWP